MANDIVVTSAIAEQMHFSLTKLLTFIHNAKHSVEIRYIL